MVKATGADELKRQAETTVSIQQEQKRYPTAVYNCPMG